MGPLLASFDKQFADLDSRARALLSAMDDADLFARPREVTSTLTPSSCGEYILRSGAMVEQTFNGITTRLWDDPFEWTLPEKLSNKAAVLGYLDEVEQTRQKAFQFFASDDDLRREMPAPEELRTIHAILLDTIAAAAHYQGCAFALIQILTGDKPPRR
jgi:hypothetical protein